MSPGHHGPAAEKRGITVGRRLTTAMIRACGASIRTRSMLEICKPAAVGDVVYLRARDFVMDEIITGETPATAWGALRRLAL